MDLVAKLPTMETAQLASLQENAERIARTGKGAQQAAAAELLPAIEAELAERRAAKAAELAERRVARAAELAERRAANPPAKRAPKARAKPKAAAAS